MVLIAISMNSPSVYEDLIKMLDYGFSNYKLFNIASKEQVSAEIKVNGGEAKTLKIMLSEDLKIIAKEDEITYITYKITSPEAIDAPVEKGSKVGKCQVYLKGKPLAEIDMTAATFIPQKKFLILLMLPSILCSVVNGIYIWQDY